MKLYILILVASLLSACNVDEHIKGEHVQSGSALKFEELNSTGIGVLSTSELSFQDIKSQILEPYCINCHTGIHKSFEMYSIVRIASNNILDRISTTNFVRRMPVGPNSLDPTLIMLFKDWIGQGKPEFVESKINEINIDSVQYSFADIKEFVLKPNNCFECHSHFEDYSTTIENLTSITSTFQTDRMPYPVAKGGQVEPLSMQQKKMWMSWVDQGAPLFVGEQAEAVGESLQPNWFSIRNNILGPKCILCHNSFGRRGPNDMSTYESLMTWFQKSPKLFDVSDPENSHFIGAIIGRVDEDEFFFDAMPFISSRDDVSDLSEVTDLELDVLKEWIGNGLPKD